ncbi:MAG: RNA polymerase sigma factor [Myxococcota bacterium]
MAESDALEALMERYVDGDVVAFDALFSQLRGPMTASLRRWLRTDDKVDDALQITWMKVHNSRTRYRRGAPVLPWVLTIARNVALDHLRSRVAKERSLDDETARRIPDDHADPIDWSAEDEQEVVAAVREAVEQLPPSSRDVVRMHKLEGRSMSEVAEILGIKEGAARVRAHRGYKALAKLLLGFRAQRQE